MGNATAVPDMYALSDPDGSDRYDPDFKPPDWAAEAYEASLAGCRGEERLLASAQEMVRERVWARSQPPAEWKIPEGSCPHAYWRHGPNRDWLIQCESPEHCRVADLGYDAAVRVLNYLAAYTDVDVRVMICRTVKAEYIGWALEELAEAGACDADYNSARGGVEER